jgi:hypothetical protein
MDNEFQPKPGDELHLVVPPMGGRPGLVATNATEIEYLRTALSAGFDQGLQDDSNYQPMSQCIHEEHYPTFKAIHTALEKNPWIRTKRPIGRNGKRIENRLLVHSGDWQRFISQQPRDLPDQPAETVDEAIDAAKRKEEIDRAKGRI